MIHVLEPHFHHSLTVGAERIARVDTAVNYTGGVGMLAYQPTEALLMERAMVKETYYVMIYLVAEDFFLCLCLISLFHAAKVGKNVDITKYFYIFFLKNRSKPTL